MCGTAYVILSGNRAAENESLPHLRTLRTSYPIRITPLYNRAPEPLNRALRLRLFSGGK